MNRVKKRQEKVSSGLVVQDFARYEFKYILSNRVRQQIESEIVHFMKYDGHVHKELNNSYYVCSLYFDSSTNEYYYEKIDGIKYRRKYRIRTYGHQPEVGLPIFLKKGFGAITGHINIGFQLNLKTSPDFVTLKEL